jgi:hypothetical protein
LYPSVQYSCHIGHSNFYCPTLPSIPSHPHFSMI